MRTKTKKKHTQQKRRENEVHSSTLTAAVSATTDLCYCTKFYIYFPLFRPQVDVVSTANALCLTWLKMTIHNKQSSGRGFYCFFFNIYLIKNCLRRRLSVTCVFTFLGTSYGSFEPFKMDFILCNISISPSHVKWNFVKFVLFCQNLCPWNNS